MEAGETQVIKSLRVSELYRFRPYKPEDIPFIQNSWGSSYYKGAEYHRFLAPVEFHHYHRPIRERLLLSQNVAIIVACDPSDEDLILGWILVEKPHKAQGLILHYLYVKEAFKREKLASRLIDRALPEGPVMFTHLTDRARKLMNFNPDKYSDFFFAPHLI